MQRKQKEKTAVKPVAKSWLDAVDLELMFINAIVVCALVLAIVAADVLMS